MERAKIAARKAERATASGTKALAVAVGIALGCLSLKGAWSNY